MEIIEINDVSEIGDFVDTYMKIFSEPPYNHEWTIPGTEVIEDLLDSGTGLCFRAVEKGRTLGIIMCHKSKWNDGVHLFIESLAVDPSHEDRGIGKRLLDHVLSKAKSEGMAGVELDVMEKSPASGFWEKMGFGYTRYRMMHRKP